MISLSICIHTNIINAYSSVTLICIKHKHEIIINMKFYLYKKIRFEVNIIKEK